jgi:hypothetical protein
MIISHPIQQPRISANQLAEYVFATPGQRVRILRDQKFGNKFKSPYYQAALVAIMHSFSEGRFDIEALHEAKARIEAKPVKNRQQLVKRASNAAMIEGFISVEAAARPPEGQHTLVWQNAILRTRGVDVSIRPEIFTREPNGLFTYTKLRFSKSEVSIDASDIVLLLLLKYGQKQSTDTAQFDAQGSKLVDCYAKTIVAGHSIAAIREQQLNAALREIVALWPSIQPRGASGDSFDVAM